MTGSEGYIAYTASKAAILAMTKTAALEHARDGIRVNAICPGGVSTPMNEDEPEGGVVPLTPLGRRAHVSEISGAVAIWRVTTRASSPGPSSSSTAATSLADRRGDLLGDAGDVLGDLMLPEAQHEPAVVP